MEFSFKQIVVVLSVLLLAVMYYDTQIPAFTGGSLGSGQAVGLVLLVLAVVVFLFGSGNIK